MCKWYSLVINNYLEHSAFGPLDTKHNMHSQLKPSLLLWPKMQVTLDKIFWSAWKFPEKCISHSFSIGKRLAKFSEIRKFPENFHPWLCQFWLNSRFCGHFGIKAMLRRLSTETHRANIHASKCVQLYERQFWLLTQALPNSKMAAMWTESVKDKA